MRHLGSLIYQRWVSSCIHRFIKADGFDVTGIGDDEVSPLENEPDPVIRKFYEQKRGAVLADAQQAVQGILTNLEKGWKPPAGGTYGGDFGANRCTVKPHTVPCSDSSTGRMTC